LKIVTSERKLEFKLVKSYKEKKDLRMFALQNSSAMGATAPWSSTMMMDRISLDDMPHKGRGNILS
jgi:formiminotetrahydrofolate cyclodeaminase